MAELDDNPDATLGRLTRRSRVLLINPPVEERRYNWLRWNQPLDLLKLSTWLKRKGVDVRLYDFMFPSEAGAVEKHLVKDGSEPGLWHFGRRYEHFETWFKRLTGPESWRPTVILITSLTSYWHVSVRKLLVRINHILGAKRRKNTKLYLYGAYPRFEPEHALGVQGPFVDLVFTRGVDTAGCVPDHELYLGPPHKRLPEFAALDIRDAGVEEQVEALLQLRDREAKAAGNLRPQTLTVAFFNDDVCVELPSLRRLAKVIASKYRRRIFVHGICGIQASSVTPEALELMGAAGFRTLYVEHERTPGGGLNLEAYRAIYQEFQRCRRARRLGEDAWLDRDGVTGFVNVGLPDDDMDRIVGTTLELNEMFGAVILKPWGWDPTVGRERRDSLCEDPREASPQWFPYAGSRSKLSAEDYLNLMRWQSIINMRVKGTTFDFLDDGNVAKLVRETLATESWKRRIA